MNQRDCNARGGIRRFLTWFLSPAMIIAFFMMSTMAFAEGDLSPALSSGDLQKVMKWIAQEVSNSRQSFCYRDSYGRGVGKPMQCAAGQQQDAGLCYTPCKSGYKGVGPVCWQHCESGYRDDGAFCAKPGPYGRGAGYPWKFGDGFNDKGMRKRCEKDHRQGCEKSGAIYYPKCRAGYHAVGCCICSPNCPTGQTDIGVSCAKKSYGRGVGKPLSTCPSGQDKDALLCYPKCKSGFHGVGPVCWQNCPSGRINCGVGCTTSTMSCVSDTANMVTSPLILAVNIATMGSSSGATSAGRFATISTKMKQLAAATKDAREIAQQVKQVGTVAYQVAQTTELWVNDYVGNFESMTNKRVVNELSRHFSGNALLWVKQQYAKNHLTLMLKSNGIETAQNVLSTVSAFDPSGVTGVISAFAKPVCSTDQSFPTFKLLSQTVPAQSGAGTTTADGSLKWVASAGAVPPNAVIGGQEPGRTLPICRGAYQGGIHPGKLVAGKCNIGWGGKEITLTRFEVLVSNNARLAWVPGPTAAGMVMGGQEPGRTLPICRGNYQGGTHPGKLVAGRCNIGWGGKEITLTRFEVLVQK
jgi:hypothetical protein